MIRNLSLFIFLCLLIGCAKQDVEVHSLNGVWKKDAKQTFTFEVTDAENPKNIIFVVRNNNNYPYSNIRFFSTLSAEGDKTTKVDTLNYVLAKPNGEWIGTGFGDTKETWFQYKNAYHFPKNGKYTISVVQAMRKDSLIGIEDFGIKLEQVQP